MPLIFFEGAKLDEEKKEKLIAELTSKASQITSIPEQFFTVHIRELAENSIGIGGKTVEKIKKEYTKKV